MSEDFESEPPENMLVTAAPATWPTADPTATPPAVAAICKIVDLHGHVLLFDRHDLLTCLNKDGCSGVAAIGCVAGG